jgi:hypothetical protein
VSNPRYVLYRGLHLPIGNGYSNSPHHPYAILPDNCSVVRTYLTTARRGTNPSTGTRDTDATPTYTDSVVKVETLDTYRCFLVLYGFSQVSNRMRGGSPSACSLPCVYRLPHGQPLAQPPSHILRRFARLIVLRIVSVALPCFCASSFIVTPPPWYSLRRARDWLSSKALSCIAFSLRI